MAASVQQSPRTKEQIAADLRWLADQIESKAIYIYDEQFAITVDIINTGDDGTAYTFAPTGKQRASIAIQWQVNPQEKSNAS